MNAVTKVSTVRVPKAGEMVASQLRRQIVLGELKEDDQLPSESVLMEQFGVSRPTLREAFRILEAEGAITVRRGVRGGARVQVPDINVAARHIPEVVSCLRCSVRQARRLPRIPLLLRLPLGLLPHGRLRRPQPPPEPHRRLRSRPHQRRLCPIRG